MKYLLLLLLTFNVQSEPLPIEINYRQLSYRIIPGCPFTVPRFEEATYENLTYEDCEKPSLEEFEEEFERYKAELIAERETRLKELARIRGLKQRFKALPDLRLAMVKCGYNQPNMKLLVKKIIKDNDTEKINCLESKNTEIESEQNARKSRASQVGTDCIKLKNETTLKPYFKRLMLRKLCNDKS